MSTSCDDREAVVGTSQDNEDLSQNSILQRTFFRLKRNIEHDPADVLVLAFKRHKGNDASQSSGEASQGEEPEIIKNIVRHAGVIPYEQDGSSKGKQIDPLSVLLNSSIQKQDERSIRQSIKRKTVDSVDKVREDQCTENSPSGNRYKVIKHTRVAGDNGTTSAEKGASSDFHFPVYDLIGEHWDPDEVVEKSSKSNRTGDPRQIGDITCNGLPLVKDTSSTVCKSDDSSGNLGADSESTKKVQYVYDVYVAHDPMLLTDEHIVDLHYDEYEFVQDEEEDELLDDADEDSNDENDYRNDYPEENENSKETSYDPEFYQLQKLIGLKIRDEEDESADSDEDVRAKVREYDDDSDENYFDDDREVYNNYVDDERSDDD